MTILKWVFGTIILTTLAYCVFAIMSLTFPLVLNKLSQRFPKIKELVPTVDNQSTIDTELAS